MVEGLYRTTDDQLGACVRIKGSDDPALLLTRDTYEANGYQPPYYELPTKDEFDNIARGVSFG